MTQFRKIAARVKVVATAAVTWLVFAAVLLNDLATRVGDLGPVGESVAQWAVRLVG